MRAKSTFSVFLFAIFMISLFAAIPAEAPAQVIKWRAQDTYGSAGGPGKYLDPPLIDWMQKTSNGRIQITRYEPGALASVGETLDALSRGVFEMGFLYPGFYTGIVPECNVEQGLPWAWTDAKAHVVNLFQFGLFDIMKKAYARHNIRLIAHFPMGDIYNIGTAKPAAKLDDLKGMKIRAVGIYADYVKAVGGVPVSIPYDEQYMALKMGTIDGYLASSGALVTHKLGEVIHHFMLPSNNSIGFVVGVNEKAWAALPADLRTTFELGAPQAAIYFATLYAGVVENFVAEAVKKYGVQFHMLSQADQSRAIAISAQLWDGVAAKSPGCKQAVDSVKETLRYLGRMP
jgi:TRAP-type C4-dicarboxylate transport system substrate-binding protein